MVAHNTQPKHHLSQQSDKLLEVTPADPEQLVDPARCYVCNLAATAICSQCKLPICEEHRYRTHELVSKVGVTLCEECSDHVEAIMPRF